MTRLTHLRHLAKGWLFPAIAGFWFVVGLLTFARDNLLKPELRTRLDTVALLPHWAVSVWLSVMLGILVVAFFEGSYRLEVKSQAMIRELTDSAEKQIAAEWTHYDDEFLIGNGPRYAPIIHIAELRKRFDDLMEQARAGDKTAPKRLLRVCPKLDEVSLFCYASSAEHKKDIRRIQQAIAEFGERGVTPPTSARKEG